MNESNPILVISNVCDTGPIEANGKIRLLAYGKRGRIEVVGLVDEVGDVVNTPIEITIWNQFVMDQFDAGRARPRFGGLTNPKWDRDGPCASLHFDAFN
jgi:hypothetical protein